VSSTVDEKACPTCHSTGLGDPELLLKNLPSEFFSIINKCQDVHTEIIDLYRSFDFYVGLVRFCRIGRFLGFPQIEQQLIKCARGLQLINEKSISQLTKIRQEALHDLWNIRYFEEVEIDHYRSADAILKNTEEKILHLNTLVRKWIDEVQIEVDKLKQLARPLRQHYILMQEINRYLPDGIHHVAAIIPPIGMNIGLTRKRFKGEAYTIFTEEQFILLPQSALDQKDEVVNGIKIEYDEIKDYETNHSLLHGSQLEMKLSQGKLAFSAPTPVLDKVTQYFDLVLSEKPFMVGSPKDIFKIEEGAPDKNEYKRATTKFVQIFRERLFGHPGELGEPQPSKNMSIKEIIAKIRQLEELTRNIDLQARNYQINIPEYQSNRTKIQQEYEDMKRTLQQLGGHLTRNMDI
jgi:hypothetical protein